MKTFLEILKLLGCLIVTLGVGFAGSVWTASSVDSWYATLRKPVLTPPGWVFAPVWTILYIMMGVAAFLVLRLGLRREGVVVALTAFAAQLGLNLLWSLVFFGIQKPLWGLVDIIALWALIVITIALFFRLSSVAGWLMTPYLAWVTFASYLNFEIWRLNR